MYLTHLSQPSVEPVTLQEAKDHIKIDYDDEDDVITGFIKSAREKLERRCGRAFVSQQWEMRVEELAEVISIPKPPTISLDSFKYLDADYIEQTMDEDIYTLADGGEETSDIIFIDDYPTDVAIRPDAVRIQFTAGYAPVDDDLLANFPAALKQAILWTVGSMYDNRESVQVPRIGQGYQEIPDSVKAIIAPHIVPRL